MIDSRLITLLTLLEEKSYTNTAVKLNFTQPAITHHIKSIEKEFNIKVFENTKTFKLTRSGEILVEYAQSSVKAYEQLLATFKKNITGPLNIGITDMACQPVFNANFFASLTDLVPSYSIDTYHKDTILKMLGDGTLDFGIIDSSFNSNEFKSIFLFRKRICAVVKSGTRLNKNRLTREIITSSPIVIGDKFGGLYKAVVECLYSKNIRIEDQEVYYSNSPRLLGKLIEANDAVGFMYEDDAKVLESLGVVKIMEFWNFKPTVNFYIVYNNIFIGNKENKMLIDKLIELCGDADDRDII